MVTSGPLTREDLEAIWRDANDEGYWRPLREGQNSGVEMHDQAAEQCLRASVAVDRSTQACYIFPWSGQTDEPASGPRKAVATLTISRSVGMQHVVLDAGLTILHVTTDYGENGAESFATGRRYILDTPTVLLPGDVGPVTVTATAEQAGTGYNLPQPGTINTILQLGSAFTSAGTILAGNILQLVPGAGDVLAPAHIKSYVKLLSGANAGQIRRVVSYSAGAPASVTLDNDWVLSGVGTGMWIPGERVVQDVTGATGIAYDGDIRTLVVGNGSDGFTTGHAVIGQSSGASFSVSRIETAGPLTPGATTWKMLDWASDLGIAVTNADFPSGGRHSMLDEIGEERGIPRSPAEPDTTYRNRIGNPADVVSPNAIRRAANRVLAPYNLACCFRQVGGKLFPGFFYDRDAYDLPNTGTNRFKLMLSLAHFRAYFLLGIPPIVLGEFGFAYDASPLGFYDIRVLRGNFYDGFPVGTRRLKAAVKAAVERARMAGVNWNLYTERLGCF